MSNEGAQAQGGSAATDDAQRGKSTIEFPYLDLDNAVDIAKAIYALQGDRCEWNQLATKLGVAPEGGGFRMRMLTAKTFGLLTYEKGQVTLTELGLHAADSSHERKARYDAFMAVPLFRKLFERLDGQPIPPIAAIERIIESMGVAPKQKDKARQVFSRSAKQAGLLELSPDRLSTPPSLHAATNETTKAPPLEPLGGGGGGGGGNHLHPFITGLLQKLPEPDSVWTVEARAKWLTTASNIFDLMYKGDDENVKVITVVVSPL